MTIVKMTVDDNKKAWDSKIKFAFWAYRIIKKSAMGKSPFELVYGMNVTLSIHLQLPVYQTLQDSGSNQDDFQSRINKLIELDEVKRRVVNQSIRNQEKVKTNFDKSSKPRVFQKGDTVLLWDKQREKSSKQTKFDSLWTCPYIIHDVADDNSFYLSDMDCKKQTLSVKEQILKLFFSENL